MTVDKGYLSLPHGIHYRVLVLPERDVIVPETLRKVVSVIKHGATVVGSKPKASPSLENHPHCDVEVQRIADEVWGKCDGKFVLENSFGKGRVVWGKELATVLSTMGIEPDFSCTGRHQQPSVMYIHKKLHDCDIYFVSNQSNEIQELECKFRVAGKVPELWFPDTGEIRRQAVFRHRGQHTVTPLRLDQRGSVFVVFREPAPKTRVESVKCDGIHLFFDAATTITNQPIVEIQQLEGDWVHIAASETGNYELGLSDGREMVVSIPAIAKPLMLSGAWQVCFSTGTSAAKSMSFSELISWTEHGDPEVKFASGTATYIKEFYVPQESLAEDTMSFLELGRVKNVARVKINGKDMGVLWKPPFRLDATRVVMPGTNLLEVRVANLWPNRLIGDQLVSQEERRTSSDLPYYPQDWPLYESGLLGPVQIRFVGNRKVRISDAH